ncbi:MAG TPA: CapA family protein [Caldithrix abyssi]|uniref:CapA family protein n=1 Tax=Caldithrix abyssi TaxID=187145 RepID=A0A7V5RN27_CALAY|nr:CapA family protein [Caldithrix abyssi]
MKFITAFMAVFLFMNPIRLLKQLILLFALLAAPLRADDSTRVITLVFGGDVTLANHFSAYVKDDYAYAFKKMPLFKRADIAMINLENPLTVSNDKQEKLFNFKAAPRLVQVLTEGGIDLVTLGNNHIYDFGQNGLLETLEVLNKKGIYYTGAGRNVKEAHHPLILKRRGIRLAFFSYYGTHKHSNSHPATIDSAGTAMRRIALIRRDIENFRPLADVIIVNFHWGLEKENYPQKEQIRLAHQVIEAGADLIIGHHPHVLQGVELYKGKAVFYSLGNFIFGGNSRTHEFSAVARVEISRRDGEVSIKPFLMPVEIDHWQPAPADSLGAAAVIDSVKKYSKIFKHSIF